MRAVKKKQEQWERERSNCEAVKREEREEEKKRKREEEGDDAVFVYLLKVWFSCHPLTIVRKERLPCW